MNLNTPSPEKIGAINGQRLCTHQYSHKLPRAMTSLDRWVVHQDKIPHDQKTGKLASSTDPTTWGSYQQALGAMKSGRWDGLGFVFTKDDDIMGIDLDHCVVDRKVAPWANEIVDALSSYTELSPSRNGVHIICRGPNLHKGHKVKYQGGAVEIYSSGRYFTVTGDHLVGTPTEIQNATMAIKALMVTLVIEDRLPPQVAHVHIGDKVPAELLEFLLTEPDFLLLWECGRSEPNFFKSDGTPDASAYDMAIANFGVRNGLLDEIIAALIHAFRIKQKFNSAKALRPDYVARTIAGAKEWQQRVVNGGTSDCTDEEGDDGRC